MTPLRATLESGETIDYLPDVIGEGVMKTVHFTPDKRFVVCFFKDETVAADPARRARLQAIVGPHNPTLDAQTGAYWQSVFCWPTAIVVAPRLGVVAPAYAANFFFATGPFQGKEKQGNWFTSPKLRRMLPPTERGDWFAYLQMSARLARALRRMHGAGLAHSDLSNKNVLVDPLTGGAVVIDIDSLVVPQLYPPDVLGTPGYIAPEVLATQNLELNDPNRVLPSRQTDQHALAVLIYEYLLGRHPLRGPKVNSLDSPEEDERLSMGPRALWIENPDDESNRAANLPVSFEVLGPLLAPLVAQAFTRGLHAPGERPGANEWERALVRTEDLLTPCANASCPAGWFVWREATRRCPWCRSKITREVPTLNFHRSNRAGQFTAENHRLVARHHARLHRWHVFDNEFAGERADRCPLGYFALQDGEWWLVNENRESMRVLGGDAIRAGQGVVLRQGMQILLSREEHGRLMRVEMT